MDWNSYDINRDNIYKILKDNGYKHLSYSQLLTYNSCPYKWKKNYADNIKEVSIGIDLLFGTAMHEVIQTWLTCMYETTEKNANEMDLELLLKNIMISEYKKGLEVGRGHFSSSVELREYLSYGINILRELKKRRQELFPLLGYNLIGIESPIVYTVNEDKKIVFVAFLDVVLQHKKTNDVIIIDLKTSYNGWNVKKKKDFKTIMQLLLYKQYYSKYHSLLIDKITILYVIAKKKLWEHSEFPQKRFQKFSPPSGSVSIKKSLKNVDDMIAYCYNDDGTYNKTQIYTKCKDKTICQYCHLYKTIHCDWKSEN
jgi:hypothetical protein